MDTMTGTGLCVIGGHGKGGNGEPLQREAQIGNLCIWHRGKLSSLLVDVRELWVDLAFIDQAGSAPKDETPKTKHTKAAEAPAPANLEVLSLRDARTRFARIAGTDRNPGGDQSEPLPPVMEMVGSWVLLLAEERPIAAELLPYSTVAQLQLLQRHADWIAAQNWVDDLYGEMGELRKELSAALRDQPYRKVGTCNLPVEGQDALCGGALIKENGDDVIKCRQCRAAWTTPQERARLAISLETA